jgi:Rps23 Pro-64 3,4-dihydroxylase Tpa1-like proline 4-hydroxylase
VNPLRQDSRLLEEAARVFQNQRPYGYVNVGALFDLSVLRQAEEEITAHIDSIPAEKNIYASHRKHKLSDINQMPETVSRLISYLNSSGFLELLTSITGIRDLHPDPELRGGGVHAIGNGGFLKLHTDFNWHSGLQMHRRLNLLIYLNDNWSADWNGQVELWNESCSERVFSLEPSLGNALLFETSDISYHGHPDPLQCPEEIFRKSIAMYYYTPSRPNEEIRFGKSEMTNYVERPGEKFESDKFRRARHKLQLLIKRAKNITNRS